MRAFTMVVLASWFTGSLARAQPSEPPADPPPDSPPGGAPVAAPLPPPPQPAIPEAPPSTVDKGVIEDANSGRSWLMPTALTEPAGTWSFSDFELLMISGGYAFTDQFSISASTLLPLTQDFPFLGIVNAKLQVVKSGNLRVALQGSLTHFRFDDSIDGMSTTNSVTIGNAGGAVTLCIDADCHSHVSGYLGAGFAREDQSSVPFLIAGSLAYRLGSHVKALLEVDSAFIAGEINEAANGFLGWYGVRFTSKNIGVDLGLAKPFGEAVSSDTGLVLGVPFVSFTYRSYKE